MRHRYYHPVFLFLFPLVVGALLFFVVDAQATKKSNQIVHDAEFYILEAQNGEKWAAEDKKLDAKLAELKKKHGAPPNIVYILWDDMTFGAVGFPGSSAELRVFHAQHQPTGC